MTAVVASNNFKNMKTLFTILAATLLFLSAKAQQPVPVDTVDYAMKNKTVSKSQGDSLAALMVRAASSYANPSWLTSLDWSKVISRPTTISGYGITDAIGSAQFKTGTSWATSTQTLAYSGDYTYTGSASTTATLPAISGSTKLRLYTITVSNTGTGNITIATNSGGSDIWDIAAVTSIVVGPGMQVVLVPNGIYFKRS